jgi:hypothetical protein
LASDCQDRVAIRIVFVRPHGLPDGWERTELFSTAQGIPGSDVSCDPDCREARRFGAATSGETFLYSADGRLLFQGGMTASRGHEGESIGRTTLIALIAGRRVDCRRSPVFGCALRNQSFGADTRNEP